MLPPAWIEKIKRGQTWLRLVPNFLYDARRYAAASALGASPRNLTQYSAVTTMAYHQLEKGLSLPEPRPFFGELPLGRLLGLLERFGADYSDCEATLASLAALRGYLEWHRRRGLHSARLDEVERRLEGLEGALLAPASRPATAASATWVEQPPIGLDSTTREILFAGRRSVRNFSEEDVPLSMISEAVRLALHAPSVCNRQGWRVRCLVDAGAISAALKYQNGNRGFGHTVNRLLVVTSTLGSFVYAGERNEGWVDGGIFAMSLMMALHAQGLASCPLNWNNDARIDRAFRRAFDIPDDEVVIMFIAVGHYRTGYSVCNSPRVPVERVLSFPG